MHDASLLRNALLGLGSVALAFITWWIVPGDVYPNAPLAAAVVALMSMLWIFEIIPVPVTSLLPLVLFPVMGILGIDETASYYGKSTIFLFLGGFLLALGLQETGVHRRIALHIVKLIGTNPARLVLGFMAATYFMSWWISNTATVMVMLPIAISVIEQAKSMQVPGPVQSRDMGRFTAGIMLGIAYAADLGGLATLVGTAPNLVYRKMLVEIFPNAPEPGFVSWMIMGLPLSFVLLVVCWVLIAHILLRVKEKTLVGGPEAVRSRLAELGPWRRDEAVSIAVFGLAALLWITGGEISIGESFTFSGWRKAIGIPEATDEVVAIACAVLLFLIPSRDRPGHTMLSWERTRDVPWGILLLFGGGFALAGGFEASGLSAIMGDMFTGLDLGSPWLLLLVVCFVLILLTEIASNTAVANLTLPILAKASVAMGLDPRLLMIPATLSASCGFMMPVATPTHAIVYGTGAVKMKQMIWAGLWLDIISLILIPLLFLGLAKIAWGIDLDTVPAWALPTPASTPP